MHLERVTTRSSEAGLAGWIASNDVTLFTMVLVMVIAMFLHTRVNRGAREQVQLAETNDAIAAALRSSESELDAARDLLDRTDERLRLTQAERDQLQQQLVERLAALAAVNAKLDALLAEKGQLETQRQALTEEKTSLLAQQTELAKSRDAITADNATLRERLDLLSTQLAEKVAALAELTEQRDRLRSQADELDKIVAALKQKLTGLDIELADAGAKAEAANAAAEERARQLQEKLAAGDKQAEDYLAQLRRAAEQLEALRAQNASLAGQLTESERRRQAELLAEAENNRQLLGLNGPLRRVAIIFDASGSMRQPGAGGGDRWAEAQEIAANWLQHLNLHECVLIVYSSSVRAFPADGSLADLRGDAGKSKRDALLGELRAIKPGGWTNTLDALRKAYEYDVDTIVLLTDGAPSRAASGVYDDALAQQIYQLCRQHPAVPVNTIGLGNYFDANMSTFLRTVASLTGGAFRGE